MKPFGASAQIDIALIDSDPANIRIIKPTKAEDEALSDSLHAQGQLQPILLREHPSAAGRFMIIAGERRFRAAKGLAWSTIAAIVVQDLTPADAVALQAVENAQRAAMHPIDTWRAMVAMQERGASLQLAAQCLGVTERVGRQLDKLGRVAPEMVEEMRKSGMPDEDELARIANAPIEKQVAVLKSKEARRGGEVTWWAVARLLESSTFSRNDAIFDVEKSGLAWQQDVFAEPGTDDEWTTSDRAGFLKNQTDALKADIAAKQKKGHAVEYAEFDENSRSIKCPTGYRQTWDKPRWVKAPAGDTRKLLRSVHAATGAVTEAWVEKVGAKRPAPGRGAAIEQDDGPSSTAYEAPAKPLEPMTNAGKAMVAAAKTEAVRTQIVKVASVIRAEKMLRILCVAICGKNVKVNGSSTSYHASEDLDEIRNRLLTADGKIDETANITAIAAELVARMVVVSNPVSGCGSGLTAEAIGLFIAAYESMPRLDSVEFLKSLRMPALIAARDELELPSALTTGSPIKNAIAGKFPRWAPPEAEFKPTAPPPPRALRSFGDDDDEDEDAEAEAAD